MSKGTELYVKLYDQTKISDLRIKYEDDKAIIFGVKRSSYTIRIPKDITPKIAYLAGVIAGDGCFHISKSKNRQFPHIKLTITGSDPNYLDLLNSIFIKTFNAGGTIIRDGRKKECYDLHINHRVIWLYFRNVLCLDKSSLNVPLEVSNPCLLKFFLAGFFDTDGYYSQRGVFGIMLSSKNAFFLRQLVKYSAEFYNLRFASVKINILKNGDREFGRAYTRLKKEDTMKFISLIPLLNQKYKWARRESNP